MTALLAAIGVRDITPEAGLPLWGYAGRAGPATGTLDPLYAKTIVFRAGDTTAAWVSLDLGRVPLTDDCDLIRLLGRLSDTPGPEAFEMDSL